MKQNIQLTDNWISALTVLVLFALITCSLPLFPGLDYDMLCWRVWSTYIAKNGVGKAYGSGTNYTPLYHYFLWFYGKIAGSPASISTHIAYLRTFTILFDFWGLWMVWKWGKLRISYLVLMLISVVNIAYYYNSVIWGQVDGIVAALVFAMLYAGWKRELLLSGIACVLAVNMKLQAVVFVPIWGILVVDVLSMKGGLKKAGVMLGGMVIVQAAILLPYAMSKGGLEAIRVTVLNATETFPVVSKNAFNFWSWFVEEPDFTLDSLPATNNLSYRNAGLMLFLISSFFALLPLLRNVIHRCLNPVEYPPPLPKEQIWLSAALVGLLFFFFNTQMHERYAHSAFIFITVYAFSTRRFIPYILFSAAYFLNLEAVLVRFPHNEYDQYLYRQGFVALLFATTIIYLYVKLLRREKTMPDITVTVPVSRVIKKSRPGKKAK